MIILCLAIAATAMIVIVILSQFGVIGKPKNELQINTPAKNIPPQSPITPKSTPGMGVGFSPYPKNKDIFGNLKNSRKILN